MQVVGSAVFITEPLVELVRGILEKRFEIRLNTLLKHETIEANLQMRGLPAPSATSVDFENGTSSARIAGSELEVVAVTKRLRGNVAPTDESESLTVSQSLALGRVELSVSMPLKNNSEENEK